MKKYYNECGHSEIVYSELPTELINLTENEVENLYSNWYVEKFGNDEIILAQNIDSKSDEHYVLKLGDENLENISKVVNKNMGISSIYQASKISNTSNYLGKIYIEKIDLEYTVFNRFNKDLLKIAPCKFNGVNLGEKGNICIAGHNYNDNRFFSRLDELEIGDKVKLVSMQNEEFEYTIYKIFETDENDTSILKSYKNYELTLLTCNNSNKKRIIIKAYIKENTKP